jgi:hypothetical protein
MLNLVSFALKVCCNAMHFLRNTKVWNNNQVMVILTRVITAKELLGQGRKISSGRQHIFFYITQHHLKYLPGIAVPNVRLCLYSANPVILYMH